MDLQREFDDCWAILGEIYGRFSNLGLNKLTLALRRVRSTIFDKSRSFNYLPEEIRFRVAESEMLLLLLGPRYGGHPGYGVRELIRMRTMRFERQCTSKRRICRLSLHH